MLILPSLRTIFGIGMMSKKRLIFGLILSLVLHVLALAWVPINGFSVPPKTVYLVVDLVNVPVQTKHQDGIASTATQGRKLVPKATKTFPKPLKQPPDSGVVKRKSQEKRFISDAQRAGPALPALPERGLPDETTDSLVKIENIKEEGKRLEKAAKETAASGSNERNINSTSYSTQSGSASTTPVAYDSNPPPPYPVTARKRGWEGKVLLKVDVSDTGRVLGVEVEESSGYDSLDEAAQKAVYRWRFSPGRQNGREVPAQVLVPIHFKLKT